VKTFIADLKQYWKERPFIWNELQDGSTKKVRFPTEGKVLVLGPHPDDPECAAVTCRLLMRFGCDLWYTIVDMSPSGVEDRYVKKWGRENSIPLEKTKIEIRRMEQISAAEMFGLTQERITFLGIEGAKELSTTENLTRMNEHLESVAPDIVIMPAGNDSNQTHVWVHQAFRQCVKSIALKKQKPVVALYNEDPKTIEMRHDLFVLFGDESGDWKRALLRVHTSQQQRNIHSRGIGFDERILNMNHLRYRLFRESLSTVDGSAKYAEVFEIELFDFPSKRIDHSVGKGTL
jgi:LmbE family N-acetylglucosaminyl deacetylase